MLSMGPERKIQESRECGLGYVELNKIAAYRVCFRFLILHYSDQIGSSLTRLSECLELVKPLLADVELDEAGIVIGSVQQVLELLPLGFVD